jgi:hypothetical protein
MPLMVVGCMGLVALLVKVKNHSMVAYETWKGRALSPPTGIDALYGLMFASLYYLYLQVWVALPRVGCVWHVARHAGPSWRPVPPTRGFAGGRCREGPKHRCRAGSVRSHVVVAAAAILSSVGAARCVTSISHLCGSVAGRHNVGGGGGRGGAVWGPRLG